MALLKVVKIGDELVFDLSKSDHRRISIKVAEKTGKAIALVIRADKDIPISCIKDETNAIASGIVDIGDADSIAQFMEA